MLTLDLTDFPLIRTERLALRELCAGDAQAIFDIRSDEQVMRYIGRNRATTIGDAEELINRIGNDRAAHMSITWGITLQSGALIGTIGYYRLKLEHHRGEVGYALHSTHWRKGYMREALQAVVDHGFRHFGFHTIEAITDPENIPSGALLASCGFEQEGLLRESYLFNGRFHDSAIWSCIAPK